MKKKHYVYVYLDPRKRGEFIYGKYSFEYEPFYIGKGFGDRMYYHLKCKGRNFYKNKIIRDLISLNIQPIIFQLVTDLTDQESMIFEIDIIKKIGRIPNGPLTNLTDGGDGHTGLIQSTETKIKRVESLKKSTLLKTVRSSEFRKNASNFFINLYKDEKYRRLISEQKKGDKNPMFGKTTSNKQKDAVRLAHKNGLIKLTEEGRIKLIENGKKRFGKKNTLKRNDSLLYRLTSPNGEIFDVRGAKELQQFCKEHKLQYHTLKNNLNALISREVSGKKIFALNTINWKIIKI